MAGGEVGALGRGVMKMIRRLNGTQGGDKGVCEEGAGRSLAAGGFVRLGVGAPESWNQQNAGEHQRA